MIAYRSNRYRFFRKIWFFDINFSEKIGVLLFPEKCIVIPTLRNYNYIFWCHTHYASKKESLIFRFDFFL